MRKGGVQMGFSDRHPLLALLIALVILGFVIAVGFIFVGQATAGWTPWDIVGGRP